MKIYPHKFCVYAHSINGQVFYVGMGRARRTLEMESRNSIWTGIVKKSDSFDSTILSWYRSSKLARRAEASEIRRLKPIANVQHGAQASLAARLVPFTTKIPQNLFEKMKAAARSRKVKLYTLFNQVLREQLAAGSESSAKLSSHVHD